MPGCTFILTLSGALKFRHPAWRICVLPLWCASFIKFDFILLSFRWFVKQRNNPIISGHTAETTDTSPLVKPINPLPDNYFQDFITFNKIDKLSSFIYKIKHYRMYSDGKEKCKHFTRNAGISHADGEQIKLARLRRELSGELVAGRAGLSRATLWAVEKGTLSVAPGKKAWLWKNHLCHNKIETAINRSGEFPMPGRMPRYATLRKQGYRVLIAKRRLVLHKVNEGERVITIYAIADGLKI